MLLSHLCLAQHKTQLVYSDALLKILLMLGRYQCLGIQLAVVAADCVTPDHVESVSKEQVKSSMLDSLLQLSKRDTRLLQLVHRGRTTRSHANGEQRSWPLQGALLACLLLNCVFVHRHSTPAQHCSTVSLVGCSCSGRRGIPG